MDWVKQFVDLFLHLDTHLGQVISQYGTWTYLILFLIVFCETGLVITPFLPGDSLLFAAGTFAALGDLDVRAMILLLVAAAILGDTVNYWVGAAIGPRAFQGNLRFLKKEHLDRTHAFYERHGGKAVVISRFLPIVRTYVPFVAGMAAMSAKTYTAYNVAGGVLWVGLLTYAGYFFGNIPWIKGNLTAIIVGIIAVSLLPLVVAYLRSRLGK